MAPIKPFLILFMLLVLAACPFSAQASTASVLNDAVHELDPWHLTGDNSIRFDNYETTGYEPDSQFPYKSTQVYSEHRFGMDRNFSEYETFSGSFAGLLNNSDYRATDEGWIFEDVRLKWQKGDAAVPFRLNLGDYQESLSYRTLQQSLKGLDFEFQPQMQLGGRTVQQSLKVFSGMSQQDWRDIEFNRNLYSGASWLADFESLGTTTFNVVHNYRDNEPRQNIGQREQVVWSAAYENDIHVLWQELDVETEFAQSAGDYDSSASPTGVEDDKSDAGVYFQVDGKNQTPLSYGFRFEDYGEHFRPHGAVIAPNRRTLSWNAAWALTPALQLGARLQHFKDRQHSENAQSTDLYGLSLAGPVENPWLENLNIYGDIFRESVEDGDRLTNLRTYSYIWDMSANVYEEWTGHFQFNARNLDEEAYPYEMIPREYRADVGHPLQFAGWAGNFQLGIVLRNISGISPSDEFGSTHALSMRRGIQTIDLNTEMLFEDGHSVLSQNVANFTGNAAYRINYGAHRFSLEFEARNRNPKVVESTQDYRFGFSYGFSFDKPASVSVTDFSWKDGYSRPDTVTESVQLEDMAGAWTVFGKLQPGLSREEAVALLKSTGIVNGVERKNLIVYEVKFFDRRTEPQKLLLEFEGDKLIRSAIRLDFIGGADVPRIQEAYHEIMDDLLNAYGQPSSAVTEGDFSASFADDIASAKLIRTQDWQDGSSSVRFGFPGRLDKRVTLEIQRAPSFASARDPKWSLSELV